jgi:pilus assembly protein FimV
VVAAAPAAAKPASAPVATAKAPLPAPVPVAEEPGLLDKILESPFVLPFGAVLAVVLAGVGIYRVRARSRKTAGETSFMESRMQPDSFFGASGGQRVDTHDGAGGASTAAGSSMNYSLSQLDAIGDVDPVAEADVYLAYGRDLQAEEILKEAMRSDPNRLAVRTKLLEVYAKRRDINGFEMLATQLFTLTRGEGVEWQKAQELGRGIDPGNPLYQPGGHPEGGVEDEQYIEPLGASTMPQSVMPSPSSFGVSSDLLDDSPPEPAVTDVDIDLSFDDDQGYARARSAPMEATMPLTPGNMPGSMSGMGRAAGVAGMAAAGAAAAVDLPSIDSDGLEFDLSELSLDLDALNAPPVESVRPGEPTAREGRSSGFADVGLPDEPDSRFNDDGDPLLRKLDLADEFRQIGDLEGARDLLNEVLANADGALKQKAQTMLDSLG